jgi:methionyl-tRNA formyltransferase
MTKIIIATIKEWNISNYFKLKENYQNKFEFHLVINRDELTFEYLNKINPQYIFFPHWSWIIQKEIYSNFNCVVFHMTDLPYGRGGSPLQNLIARGVYDTKISALKVDGGLDTGDIYIKENFNVSLGNAEEIYIQLSDIIFNSMIPKIMTSNLVPQKQVGEIVTFKRRKPEESDLFMLEKKSLKKLYDFIRMLDAEGYPKAYIKFNNIKIEFSQVHGKNNKLIGKFEVIENE